MANPTPINDILLKNFDMALNRYDLGQMEKILDMDICFSGYDFSKILINAAGITKESDVLEIMQLLSLKNIFIVDNSHQLFFGMIRYNYLCGIKFLLQLNQIKIDTLGSAIVGAIAFGSTEM